MEHDLSTSDTAIEFPNRGRFITFEGGEGAGKSTQCRILSEMLEQQGFRTLVTREPGGSEGAEAIRELFVNGPPDRWDAVSEALLVYAARRDHVVRTIAPALADGIWVVCDRFSDSTMAYQGIAGGLGANWITDLDRAVMPRLPKPDLTLILDLPPASGLARAASRGGADRFERRGSAFHDTLHEAFRAIGQQNPQRCRIIDADRPVEQVSMDVCNTVSKEFSAEMNNGA